ncbi:hypothetical protein SRABI106_02678 [Rahnella aquatilis]|nr:hypothetical protein SRABI106_02678 [Rahnella aquatilis]
MIVRQCLLQSGNILTESGTVTDVKIMQLCRSRKGQTQRRITKGIRMTGQHAVFGVDHRHFLLHGLRCQQRLRQHIRQTRQTVCKLCRCHIEKPRRRGGVRAGVESRSFGLRPHHQPFITLKLTASGKHDVLEQVRQTGKRGRFVMTSGIRMNECGSTRGLWVVKHVNPQAVCQRQ